MELVARIILVIGLIILGDVRTLAVLVASVVAHVVAPLSAVVRVDPQVWSFPLHDVQIVRFKIYSVHIGKLIIFGDIFVYIYIIMLYSFNLLYYLMNGIMTI